MYTIDDIQIFIMTHNRANFLKESIESILNQTARVKNITILDNDSTDNTKDVVFSYANIYGYVLNDNIDDGGGGG